ncbi:hypothetical protein L6N65_004352 [Escherichia coli]|nr:hypothetical protein [Escherichia coli]EIV8348253.1 hypothetical protein [Escherichia coli]
MKKLIIASAIALTMTAGSVMAAQGEVQFFGTVTEKTCDLVISTDNGGNVSNLIQLGSVNTGGDEGNVKNIIMKPANAGSCNTISTAEVTWASAAFNSNGIANASQSEGATDAYVKLKAKESGTNTVDHTDALVSGKSTAIFTVKNMDDGLAFQASLVGGTVAGAYQSTAAYSVTYQ